MEKTILAKVASFLGRRKKPQPNSEPEVYLERKRRVWEESLKYVQELFPSKT